MCCVGGSETSTGSRALLSTFELSEDSAAAKAVERTVKILIGMAEEARTVEIAFPAYIGRVNVVELAEGSCSRDVMSDMAGTSNFAATRGRRDLAEGECAATTCVKGEPLPRIFSKRGDRISGNSVEYCLEVECNNEVKPLNLACKHED